MTDDGLDDHEREVVGMIDQLAAAGALPPAPAGMTDAIVRQVVSPAFLRSPILDRIVYGVSIEERTWEPEP